MSQITKTSYKPTHIPWIGEIPEDWEVKRLKFIAKIETWYTPPKANADNYSDDGIPWIKPDNLDGLIYLEDSFEKISTQWLTGNPIIHKDDILVCCIGTVGKMGIAGCDLTFNQQINSIQFGNEVDRQFGKFLILSSQEEHLRSSQVVVLPILNKTKQSNIHFPLPPLPTQTAIANFLDHKTEQISTLISDKKKLIDLLKEQKQAIIHRSVTKGIDPKAKMKESGILWIGEIPEGWKSAKVKQVVSIKMTDWPHETPEFFEEWVPFASVESVFDGKINFEFIRGHISKEQNAIYSQKCKPQRNDIFIVKSWSTTGKIAVIEEDIDFNIWSPLALVRVNKNLVYYKYLYYFFISEPFQKQVQTFWSFWTQPNIGMWVLENLSVSLPPIIQQTSIVQQIEKETGFIDTAIAKIEKEITLIEEYRTSLIYQAVTGKISIS